ncbi:MAG TPA: polysaccharide deacetylase family protein [Terriglobales bacterium]|nr:polysaccharide deacetylase family protein [Terriglobales bacterium]
MLASIVRPLRLASLAVLKGCGALNWVRDSRWRDQRLLILCFHGISIEEEHLWRPATYIHSTLFGKRLELLARGRYQVLPLADAVDRLYRGDLPSRSAVITFDDGTYDFLAHAFPALKKYSFPATVYQTTYYCDYDRPVFHLICSYMLWKRRGQVLDGGQRVGLAPRMDLRTETSRQAILDHLVKHAEDQKLTEQQKNQLAEELAGAIGIDYDELVRKRILQLLRPNEVSELAPDGVDFQLHTHRHRTPLIEGPFRQEIRDNRYSLQSMLKGQSTRHFCYPSGVYEPEFLPWLASEEVVSATTCDPGMASRNSNPLLLPRFVDTSYVTDLEFEGWLSGAASLLPRRKRRKRRRQLQSVMEPAATEYSSLENK